MAVRRITRQRRVGEIPQDIIPILHCGADHFGQLPGGVKNNLDLLREAWNDPTIREQVYQRFGVIGRLYRPCPWAEAQFGK
jgi:hypothetical protein